MSRKSQAALAVLALAAVGAALYWVFVHPRGPVAPASLTGLAAVPAEAGLAVVYLGTWNRNHGAEWEGELWARKD